MENNGTPYEVIAAPYTVWMAPLGTTFPDVGSDPSASWEKIGISGDKSQTEAGVKVKHDQSLKKIFSSGATGPIKMVRDQEDMEISFEIMDLTLDSYSHALNENAVASTVAVAGTNAAQKAIGLRQGITVAEMALLVRGPSPYGADIAMQYELPRCIQSGKPSPVFAKGKPTGLALAYTVLEDLNAPTDDARFGYLRARTA